MQEHAKRGECATCHRRQALRKDGTIGRHEPPGPYLVRPGTQECAGTGEPPCPFDPAGCAKCMAWVGTQPHLVGAAASVGVEYGKSTGRVIREYLGAYHGRGHREAR